MILFVLAFFGGVLTILSPCILPILPFTFARADQPFRKSGLPLLLSMAVTFSVVASLAVVGGSWLVRANQYGRIMALLVFLRSSACRFYGPLLRNGFHDLLFSWEAV